MNNGHYNHQQQNSSGITPTTIICEICDSNFDGAIESFWHCTTCSGGDFDMCGRCAKGGARCHCRKDAPALEECRVVDGRRDRVKAPGSNQASQPPAPTWHCNTCRSNFDPTVKSFWYCNTCENGDFDLCEACAKGGQRCHCGKDAPALVECRVVNGERRQVSDGAPPPSPRASMFCSHCKVEFDGAAESFWHCATCDDGDFDLCGACAGRGDRCHCNKDAQALEECRVRNRRRRRVGKDGKIEDDGMDGLTEQQQMALVMAQFQANQQMTGMLTQSHYYQQSAYTGMNTQQATSILNAGRMWW